jgi:hypothetical protein
MLSIDIKDLPQVITAIGGLGTAAFGIVDASKAVLGSLVNGIGFGGIQSTVATLTPVGGGNTLPPKNILSTLKANWCNGTDLSSQKSIAKSLIKLNLDPQNAPTLASATNVDANILKAVAAKIAAGASLLAPESDVYARFDLIVTAKLDEAYQYADNAYRNWTRFLASLVALGLAIAGGSTLSGGFHQNLVPCILAGLLATPIAPVAKDLSTALATAVNSMQSLKK